MLRELGLTQSFTNFPSLEQLYLEKWDLSRIVNHVCIQPLTVSLALDKASGVDVEDCSEFTSDSMHCTFSATSVLALLVSSAFSMFRPSTALSTVLSRVMFIMVFITGALWLTPNRFAVFCGGGMWVMQFLEYIMGGGTLWAQFLWIHCLYSITSSVTLTMRPSILCKERFMDSSVSLQTQR